MPDPAPAAGAALLGSSSAMARLRAQVGPAAASDAPVFLVGESGTGKDLVAQAIHAAATGRNGRLVVLNASGVPDDILDRELYGAIHGGGTAPYPSVPRYLALAQGGTLYLDDICRASPMLQARLLHLIQNGLAPVNGVPQPFTARLISATNSDLEGCLRSGTLRRDLYDRLAVVTIHLPPLRHRGGDAGEIAAAVYPQLLARFGLPEAQLPQRLQAQLNALDWPGNVRQLLNVVRRMVLAPPPGGGPELPAELLVEGVAPPQPYATAALQPMRFAEIERQAILASIERNDGSIQRAADELGLAASTLYRKLKQWQPGS